MTLFLIVLFSFNFYHLFAYNQTIIQNPCTLSTIGHLFDYPGDSTKFIKCIQFGIMQIKSCNGHLKGFSEWKKCSSHSKLSIKCEKIQMSGIINELFRLTSANGVYLGQNGTLRLHLASNNWCLLKEENSSKCEHFGQIIPRNVKKGFNQYLKETKIRLECVDILFSKPVQSFGNSLFMKTTNKQVVNITHEFSKNKKFRLIDFNKWTKSANPRPYYESTNISTRTPTMSSKTTTAFIDPICDSRIETFKFISIDTCKMIACPGRSICIQKSCLHCNPYCLFLNTIVNTKSKIKLTCKVSLILKINIASSNVSLLIFIYLIKEYIMSSRNKMFI